MTDVPTQNIVLPEGVAVFTHIAEPDPGNERVKGGEYKLTLEYDDGSVLSDLKTSILKVAKAFDPSINDVSQLHLPVRKTDDGKIWVKCTSRFQPSCVDERGEEMLGNEIRVYGGDTVQVACTLRPYAGTNLTNGRPGVSLFMHSLQRLAKGGAGGGQDNPFKGRNVLGDSEEVVVRDDESSDDFGSDPVQPVNGNGLDEPPF